MPMDNEAWDDCYNMWKGTDLFKKGIVPDVSLPALADLVEIEDPSADTVPTTSCERHGPRANERVFQIGTDAANKLFKSFMEGSPAKAILVVDLAVRSGDMLKGFLKEKFENHQSGIELYYLGFCESELEAFGLTYFFAKNEL